MRERESGKVIVPHIACMYICTFTLSSYNMVASFPGSPNPRLIIWHERWIERECVCEREREGERERR